MRYDAVIVGSGPNGLSAAITLARAGHAVRVLEAEASVGGGMRSAELTLPGFVHDVCSTVHPLAVTSPFFRDLPLADHGLGWIFPPAAAAHPLDDGTAVLLEGTAADTARGLGRDAAAYRRLVGPLAAAWKNLFDDVLAPLHVPAHPLLLARFGVPGLLPAATLARLLFREERARALFAGLAAHGAMPLSWPVTSAFGLVLGIAAHAVGWPLARGGSRRIAEAMAAILRGLGGTIETGHPVRSLADLPETRTVLFDVAPRQVLEIAGERLPARYRRALGRFRYGAGVCKVDWALDGPIPWRARGCLRAATVHVGGTMDEIEAGEAAVWQGNVPERPFVLVVQPSLFDETRVPAGRHTAWAYCHVPHGSDEDMTGRIEAQIERFAPGFRDRILGRHTHTAVEMEAYNPNYAGGDINGGVQDLRQLFTRPVPRRDPYRMPAPGFYICSSSTPPGGGVHGMCGYHAAQSALQSLG